MFVVAFFALVGAQGNQPPVITSAAVSETPMPNVFGTVGDLYSYLVEATDPDAGDVLTYSLDMAPAGLQIDPATGLVQWTPSVAQEGYHDVVVRVTDQGGLFDRERYTIGIRPEGAFAVSITGPLDAAETEERTIDVTGTVSEFPVGAIVRLRGLTAEVMPSGEFRIPLVPLVELENVLFVQLIANDMVLASDTVRVTYLRPADASAIVTETTGAELQVDDPGV